MENKEDKKYGRSRAKGNDIPPYKAAIIQFQDKAKKQYIKTLKAGNDSEWDSFKLNIEYSAKSKFENILDFFVNLPSLEKDLNNEFVTNKWYWEPIEPKSLSKQFYYRSEIVAKLRAKAGNDSMINDGWMLRYTDGRIDGETTWSDASYLFSTNSYYAYVQLYTEQDH